jgi:hypothetical protein
MSLLHISVQKRHVFCTGFENFPTLLERTPQMAKDATHTRTGIGQTTVQKT